MWRCCPCHPISSCCRVSASGLGEGAVSIIFTTCIDAPERASPYAFARLKQEKQERKGKIAGCQGKLRGAARRMRSKKRCKQEKAQSRQPRGGELLGEADLHALAFALGCWGAPYSRGKSESLPSAVPQAAVSSAHAAAAGTSAEAHVRQWGVDQGVQAAVRESLQQLLLNQPSRESLERRLYCPPSGNAAARAAATAAAAAAVQAKLQRQLYLSDSLQDLFFALPEADAAAMQELLLMPPQCSYNSSSSNNNGSCSSSSTQLSRGSKGPVVIQPLSQEALAFLQTVTLLPKEQQLQQQEQRSLSVVLEQLQEQRRRVKEKLEQLEMQACGQEAAELKEAADCMQRLEAMVSELQDLQQRCCTAQQQQNQQQQNQQNQQQQQKGDMVLLQQLHGAADEAFLQRRKAVFLDRLGSALEVGSNAGGGGASAEASEAAETAAKVEAEPNGSKQRADQATRERLLHALGALMLLQRLQLLGEAVLSAAEAAINAARTGEGEGEGAAADATAVGILGATATTALRLDRPDWAASFLLQLLQQVQQSTAESGILDWSCWREGCSKCSSKCSQASERGGECLEGREELQLPPEAQQWLMMAQPAVVSSAVSAGSVSKNAAATSAKVLDSLAAAAASELEPISLVAPFLAKAFRLFLRHRLPFLVFAAAASDAESAVSGEAAPPFSGRAALRSTASKRARGETEASVVELLQSAEPLCVPHGVWGCSLPALPLSRKAQPSKKSSIGFLEYWISLDAAFAEREINTKAAEGATTQHSSLDSHNGPLT
ncbi:uncharacterized protein LOC113146501, partial [Cyclospora cayetanensis]|uniref:Uncharacterized protein LOC113146501 n=1 Tax=Cyclospora cayetanensis TaxID=88456 RepID=A0A6P6RQF1_9EIME